MDIVAQPSARSLVTCFCLVFAAMVVTSTAVAQQHPGHTRIMVRAVSHDAKIVGSGVGGARIVIQDALTGEVLDEGLQEGGTGSTERIITSRVNRDGVVYNTEGAAGYLAKIRIGEPTLVDITAYGPLDADEYMPRASKRMLILPGGDVLGEGVILELNGFTVEVLSTESGTGNVVHVRSSVTMLCGCPTEPGGLWNADDIDVKARLVDGRMVVAEEKLEYAGTTSTYEGKLSAPGAGAYVLEVTASEPAEGNFGLARRLVEVR